jgi:hypothetical protein
MTCSPSIDRKREARREKLASRSIVMWDGEGITRNENHEYVMLCNSEGEHLSAKEQLDTVDIFHFLVDHAGDKDTLNVAFAAGYDVAMWLKPLSGLKNVMLKDQGYVTGEALIEAIFDKKSQSYTAVHFVLGGYVWTISYRPRKQFILHRKRCLNGEGKPKGSFTMWDVWGFYQGSFVSALRSHAIDCDIDAIEAMKEKRHGFSDADFDEMRSYCFDECRAGVKLFRTTLDHCLEADILPTRFDGPGALAASTYKKEGVKEQMELEPEPVREAVATAYFGGRIECASIGQFDDLLGYDISSAYPAQIQNLPSLKGTWNYVEGPPSDSATGGVRRLLLLDYDFRGGESFYPLPYRTPSGAVLFSPQGRGWYWDVEHDASLAWCDRFLQPTPETLGYWEFAPEDASLRPFKFIPDLYDTRVDWKALGRASEKILKLTLNSLYGKTAQQLGGSLESLPPFFSLVWAGLITAGTRAELLRAACKARTSSNVVAFMTDGLYVREELEMPVAKGVLGAWEPPERYEAAVFVQAGVYWTMSKGAWKARYRGFDKKTMQTPEHVLEAWKLGQSTVNAEVTRFQSFQLSLMGAELWKNRCQWVTSNRDLNLVGDGTKRCPNLRIFTEQYVNLKVKDNAYCLGRDKMISRPFKSITLSPAKKASEQQDDDMEAYEE